MLKVTIEGEIREGKSTLAYALARLLKQHGVPFGLHDDNRPEAMTDERIDRGLDAIGYRKRAVSIRTVTREKESS